MIRSRPHRAVLALLRAGLGLAPGPGAAEDLRRAPPERVIAIASAHRLLQMLAPPEGALAAALEPDARRFLEEMRAANARRNARLAATLEQIGARLAAAGIEAVVLKGGAELVDPFDGAAGRRFVGDLDLLVAPEEIDAARRILLAAGWRETEMAAIERARHHHLPGLVHPDAPGAVELHRRLGDARVEAALPAAALRARSAPAGLAGLRLPARADRLAHLALHAQMSNSGWADRRLRLCDAADLVRVFAGGGAAEAAAARAAFARIGEARRFDGLLLAAAALLPGGLPAPEGGPEARAWAASAAARVGRPNALRWSWLRRRAAWRLRELVTNAERRRHWAARLREPGRARRLLAETGERLQGFR